MKVNIYSATMILFAFNEICRTNNVNLEKLLDAMPLNVYWKDKNGRYLGCNLAQAHFFGLQNSAQLIGKTDLEVSGDIELAKIWMTNDQQVMNSGNPLLTEETAVSHNKIVNGISCKIPFKDDSGNIAGMMGITFDISEQKAIAAIFHKKRSETPLNPI